MKKTVCVLLALALCLLAACGAPASTAESDPKGSGPQDELETALRAAATVDEAGDILKLYVESGNYEAQLRCLNRMLEIDPENEGAWRALSEIRILLLKSEYEELADTIQKGFDHASDKAEYVKRMKGLYDEANLKIDFPFASDYTAAEEINTVGNTSENLMSIIFGPEWAVYGGLFASQADWIYFSDPDDGFALYKKQIGGEEKTRLCEDSVKYLNVMGDFIYFVNISDNNTLYKIRTDGDMKTKLSDDLCGAVAAKGDWLYFSTKDERNLFRMSLTDGQTQQLLNNEWHVNLVISGDWLYYISDNNGLCIKKMKADGSEKSEVWKYNAKINVFAVCGDRIVVCVRDLSEDEYILVFDAQTMRLLVQSETFATGALCTDTAGNVYVSDAFGSGAWHEFDLETGTVDKI